MSRTIGSHRAPPAPGRPLYSRVLRLRHIDPSGMLCLLFFEAMIGLAVLLALAELVTWWAVLVLPATVAVMVKFNDVVAGAVAGSGGHRAGSPHAAGFHDHGGVF